jgi:hypothetical protein
MTRSQARKALKVTFTLNGAKPTKLYQVGFHLFCTTAPAKLWRPVRGDHAARKDGGRLSRRIWRDPD